VVVLRKSILIWALAALSSRVLALPPIQSSTTSGQKKTTTQKKRTAVPSRRRKRSSPRLRRMHQAFVASATLKPMARQLIQDRTPAAYAGVQAYAVRHGKEDAGALAWLVIGYAHILDHEYAKAIDPLNRAKPHAGDLGDYVNFYLGTAYQQTGRLAEAIATFAAFDKNYPDSLLIRDAHITYASALVADGRAAEAVELLENDRQPTRADLELALGRAYEADNQPAKALAIFRSLYYTMPLSWEANQVQGDVSKLAAASQATPVSADARRTRADLLAKGKQFSEAAVEYRQLMAEASAEERPTLEIALADALRRSGQNREAKKILEAVPSSAADINAARLFNLTVPTHKLAKAKRREPVMA